MKIKDKKYSPSKPYENPSDRVKKKIEKRIKDISKFNWALIEGKSISSIDSDTDLRHNISVASTKVEFNSLSEYLKETHPLFFNQDISLCILLASCAKLLWI